MDTLDHKSEVLSSTNFFTAMRKGPDVVVLVFDYLNDHLKLRDYEIEWPTTLDVTVATKLMSDALKDMEPPSVVIVVGQRGLYKVNRIQALLQPPA
jgi:hypothetical protein